MSRQRSRSKVLSRAVLEQLEERRLLSDVHLIGITGNQQDDNPDPVNESQPRGAVRNRRRRSTQTRHLAFVGQQRARCQIDEDFRRRLIEANERRRAAGDKRTRMCRASYG